MAEGGDWVFLIRGGSATTARLALESALTALAFDRTVRIVTLDPHATAALDAQPELLEQLDLTAAGVSVPICTFAAAPPPARTWSQLRPEEFAHCLDAAAQVLSY